MGNQMRHEDDLGPQDEPTEDSIVTVARWKFRGRLATTIGTVLAAILAAVAAYYGALS